MYFTTKPKNIGFDKKEGLDNRIIDNEDEDEDIEVINNITETPIADDDVDSPLYKKYISFPIPSGYTMDDVLKMFRHSDAEISDMSNNKITKLSMKLDKQYDKDNLDAVYHSDPQQDGDAKKNLVGYALMKDSRGNDVEVPYAELKGQTLYNLPGSMKFGPSSYVPNYEETVYLSQLTNETPFQELHPNEEIGFCKQYENSPEIWEQKCNSLSGELCSSTDCCVNLGGAKCVAGGANGPLLRNNYGDFMIKNRDYYFYKGKCYGNCDNSLSIKYEKQCPTPLVITKKIEDQKEEEPEKEEAVKEEAEEAEEAEEEEAEEVEEDAVEEPQFTIQPTSNYASYSLLNIPPLINLSSMITNVPTIMPTNMVIKMPTIMPTRNVVITNMPTRNVVITNMPTRNAVITNMPTRNAVITNMPTRNAVITTNPNTPTQK